MSEPSRSAPSPVHVDRRRPSWGEVVGFALFAGLVAVAAAASGGDRSTFILLVVASASAWLAGRLAGSVRPTAVPAVVALGGVLVAASVWGDRAVGPAAGAALALAGIACAIVAARGARSVAIAASALGAVLLVVAAAISGVAAVALVTVPLAAVAVIRPRWTRPAAVVAAVLFAVVLGATLVAAASGPIDDPAPAWAGLAGERRVTMWRSAWTITTERPGGVGPGRFDNVPPRYLPEGSVRYADHDFLQQGAELGWAGLGLTIAIFAWAFATLVPVATEPIVAFVAAAVAVVGVSAMFGPVLHVAAVPVLAAALLGTGHAARSRASTSR